MLNIFRNIYLVTICQFASEEHLFHFFFKSWGRFLANELNSLYILDIYQMDRVQIFSPIPEILYSRC